MNRARCLKVRDLLQKRKAELDEMWRLCFKDGRQLGKQSLQIFCVASRCFVGCILMIYNVLYRVLFTYLYFCYCPAAQHAVQTSRCTCAASCHETQSYSLPRGLEIHYCSARKELKDPWLPKRSKKLFESLFESNM